MEALILDKARELFFSYGLKSVSMDDLARRAGVSKKTIYEAVSDKNALVQKVVEAFIQCQKDALERSRAEAGNAVKEVVLYAQHFNTVFSIVRHSFFYELEKYFPAVWNEMIRFRQQSLLPYIMQNLERGISEGVYRSDLDIPFLADLRFHQIAAASNPHAFTGKATHSDQLLMQLTDFYLHAITSNKGKPLIKKYLKNEHAI